MGNNNLVEEKALGYGKVSVFLDEDFDHPHPPFDGHDHDDQDSFFDDHLHNSMERTIFWESQEALLQVVYNFLLFFFFVVMDYNYSFYL